MREAASAKPAGNEDVRPVVRTSGSGNRQLWLFGAVLLLGGLLLFRALSSHREAIAPATRPMASAGGVVTAPPPLSLPSQFREPGAEQQGAAPHLVRLPAPQPASMPAPQQTITRVVEVPAQSPPPMAQSAAQPLPPPPAPVVIEQPAMAAQTRPEADDDRVMAGRLRNPSLTVPQGAIMAAVLETALDSTRPGAVRAIIARDVRSFDGSRVLIPRGSRLYGEYAADVTAGQKRALIRWQRLTRPDAVIIRLDSPVADPLGRAGVEGEVDSKFFARFGAAIVQSVLDIGVGIATREATDGVIVALPGSTQQITGQQQQAQVQPTLRVRQGTSVSVFVARDLDFSTVDS